MEQRLSAITLGVSDLGRARSFYEALGWGGAQQPDDEICFFQAGGTVFGLWTALGGHGAPGLEHVTTSGHLRRSTRCWPEKHTRRRCDSPARRQGRLGGHHWGLRRPGRLRLGSGAQPRLDGRRGRLGAPVAASRGRAGTGRKRSSDPGRGSDVGLRPPSKGQAALWACSCDLPFLCSIARW